MIEHVLGKKGGSPVSGELPGQREFLALLFLHQLLLSSFFRVGITKKGVFALHPAEPFYSFTAVNLNVFWLPKSGISSELMVLSTLAKMVAVTV